MRRIQQGISGSNYFVGFISLPEDMCQVLCNRIRNGTVSTVSDGSYNSSSPIGPVGTSAVIMAPSANMRNKRHWTRGWNWVRGPASSQSAYRSKLTGVIASLTMLDIIVCHNNITEGQVTIALDGLTVMQQAGGDWPLILDQECFDYLQIIRAWIKLSPLSFTFRHVKGHQTDLVAYSQLNWRDQRNEDLDGMVKDFLLSCTGGHQDALRQHVQPILHLEKWALAHDGMKFTCICRDSLYTNLYGSRTLAYWAEKDHTPKDPKSILWEESLSAYKRVYRSQQRIDTKLLCNRCGFENRK